MGHAKSQSFSLFRSTGLACALVLPLVAALPSQERKLGEPLFEPVDFPPDIATRAPLMRRATEDNEVAHGRYLRQVQAAAVFEASRLSARALREQEEREGELKLWDALMTPKFGLQPPSPLSLSPSLEKAKLFILMTIMTILTTPMIIAKAVIRSIAVDGDETVTLVAPLSVRPTEEHLPEAEKEENTVNSGIMSLKARARTEQKIDPSREEMRLDMGGSSEEFKDGLSSRGIFEARGQTANKISGIIDLVQGSPDGEKLGGLSVSALPPNNSISATTSSIYTLLIDSTSNLVDQATFFMHTFEDQSTLDHETPAGVPRDLLVALEIPDVSDRSSPKRLLCSE
ncbi:hypothetical protein BN14_12085 [Rhizoctonia solani AG-1 IB]|uniref:Uncharacterized protein n=1 Tax=Thanatephorus cucumeris (strain AG1-IB / isolate 7/3/14) TaxID=1108050 RepID=M5CF65_THACB|nr:hypothetical protein BN14_12085 [Rhizoctonia solani AG-1 IB]